MIRFLFILTICTCIAPSSIIAQERLDSLINEKKRISWNEEIARNKIEFQLDLSKEYYYAGRLKEAKEAALDGINYLEDETDELLKAKAHLYLGNMLLENSEFANALTSFNIAHDIYGKNGNDRQSALVLGNIAVVFERLKNYELALEYNLKAIEFKKALGDSIGLSNSYTNIGNIYLDLDNFELGLAYYNRAIHIDSNMNDARMLSADYNNLGALYSELKDFEKALAYYQKTLKIDRKNNDVYGQAIAYNNMAETYYQLEQYKNSMHSCREAIKYADSASSRRYVSMNYELLSRIYTKLKDDKKALEYFQLYSQLSQSLLAEKTDDIKISEIVKGVQKLQNLRRKSGDEKQNGKSESQHEIMNFRLIGISLFTFLFGGAVLFYWSAKRRK